MKCLFFVLSLFLVLPAAAYQTGPANRANFGSSPQTQQQTGYRSFSNYNSRWNQGVPTQPVQTSLAGSSVKDFSANTQPMVGKQSATPPTKGGKPTSVPPAAAAPTQASSATAAMPANVDPSAMMQQVQGMMQSMQSLTGGAPAAGGQAAASATGGQMPAMPAMPDMSSLMNGMMNPGAAPAAAPAQK